MNARSFCFVNPVTSSCNVQWVRSLQREIHYQIMQMNLGDPGIPLVKHIFSSCVRVCAEYLLLQVICISIFHVYSRSLEFGTIHKWDDYSSSSPLKPIWSDSKQYYLSWLLATASYGICNWFSADFISRKYLPILNYKYYWLLI